MGKLQSIPNAATWLITGTRWCEHITPVHTSYTGFLFGDEWSTRSISHCLARHQHTYFGISTSSPTVITACSIIIRKIMRCPSCSQQFRRQKFRHCWSSCVEQPTTQTATGHQPRTLAATNEIIFSTPQHFVTFFMCHRNTLTYLLMQ